MVSGGCLRVMVGGGHVESGVVSGRGQVLVEYRCS